MPLNAASSGATMLVRPPAVGKCAGKNTLHHPTVHYGCLLPPSTPVPPASEPLLPQCKRGEQPSSVLSSLTSTAVLGSINVHDIICHESLSNHNSTGGHSIVATHPSTTPSPKCTSARHLMRSIKECRQWEQLLHLVQVNSFPSHASPPMPSHISIACPGEPHEQIGTSTVQRVGPVTPGSFAGLPFQPHSFSQQLPHTQPGLIPNLDAPTINYIHLAAILTHLAQLGVDPNTNSQLQAWCMSLLQQVAQPPLLQAFNVRQLSNIVWACSQLGMHGLAGGGSKRYKAMGAVRQMQQLTHADAPSLKRVHEVRAWGSSRHVGVQARCWRALLEALEQRMCEAKKMAHIQLQEEQVPNNQASHQEQVARGGSQQQAYQQQHLQSALNMQDITNVVYACALSGQDPGPEWMCLALQASQPLMPQLQPKEAASWAYALCTLGVMPSREWATAYVRVTGGLLRDMTPQELALVVRGVPGIMRACIDDSSQGGSGAMSSGKLRSWGNSVGGVFTGSKCSSKGSNAQSSSGMGGSSEDFNVGTIPCGNGLHDIQPWQLSCYAALSQALPQLEVVQVSAVLWGLSLLGWQPDPPLMAALLRAVSGSDEEGMWPLQLTPVGQNREQNEHRKSGACGFGSSKESGTLGASEGGFIGGASKAQQGQLSGRCAANVLTATARLGVKPQGAWVRQLIDALILSAKAGEGSCSMDVTSLNWNTVPASHPALPSLQPQQQKPRPERASASRLLSDVNAAMLACVLLRYQPPPYIMHQLVGLALEGLMWATPSEVADMLWALAKLRYVPHKGWLAVFFSVTGRVLHHQALRHQKERDQLVLQQQQQRQALEQSAPEQQHQALQHEQLDLRVEQNEQGTGGQSTSGNNQGQERKQAQPLQQQQQQQQQRQSQQGEGDGGFDANALCKLLWALASFSQMQRAVPQQLRVQHHAPASHPPAAVTSKAAPGCRFVPQQPLSRQQQDHVHGTREQEQHSTQNSSNQLDAPAPSSLSQRVRNIRRHLGLVPMSLMPPAPVPMPHQPSPEMTLSPPSALEPQAAPPTLSLQQVPLAPPPPLLQTAQHASDTGLHAVGRACLQKAGSSGGLGASLTGPTNGGALPARSLSHPLPPPSAFHTLLAPRHLPPAPSPPSQAALPQTFPLPLHPPRPPAVLPHPPTQQQQPLATASTLPHLPSQPLPPPPLLPPAWRNAALAVLHAQIPNLAPQHLPEVSWALAALDIVPLPASRRRLAAAVAQHVGQLAPKHVATVVGSLPRMCVRRVHDVCGMLGVVMQAGCEGLHEMQPNELTYFLRGLHGMGYVLSKKALLQLATHLAVYPLHKLAAKGLVAVVDALAGLDMGLLPPSTQSRPSHATNSNGSHSSAASATNTPVLQLQQTLLSQLQPRLKSLHLPQIASLVNSLALLGWRPPSSFWPCLYAAIGNRLILRSAPSHAPSPTLLASGQVSASVLLALAKYGGLAAAVEEADAAAAALRAEDAAKGAKAGQRATGQAIGPAGQATLTSDAAAVEAELGQTSLAVGVAAGAAAAIGSTENKGEADVAQQAHAPELQHIHHSQQQPSQQLQSISVRHDQFLLPPGVLVQHLLNSVTDDLAALRPSEVAELVLALVRLRHDPGGSWMRGLLDHLETRSAACNREDHQLLQRAWRRLSRARKAGLVHTHKHQHSSRAPQSSQRKQGSQRQRSNTTGVQTSSLHIRKQHQSKPRGLKSSQLQQQQQQRHVSSTPSISKASNQPQRSLHWRKPQQKIELQQ